MLSFVFFFFQAEDGIRDLVRSRGLGDVYKRQDAHRMQFREILIGNDAADDDEHVVQALRPQQLHDFRTDVHVGAWQNRYCLLYTSDAADERSSVDLGGRRIIKKKN